MSHRIAERYSSRRKHLMETFSGPSSYSSGGNVYNSTLVRNIERAACLNVTGGLLGEVVTGSVSGNAFTLKIYTCATSGAIELSGGNLIKTAITVLIEGL